MVGTALFAHQGGWDEALFVLAPLALFAILLLVARRRVDRMEAENDTEKEAVEDATAVTGDERSHDTT